MFERIRQSVLALGEGAGALFPFAAPFLACAPVFLFLVWFVLCLCSRRVRKGSKSAYLFVCDFFLLLFAALALFSPDALAAVGFALAVRALCTGLYGILCLFGRAPAQVPQAKQAPMPPPSVSPSPLPPAEEKPRLVRCFPQGGEVVVGEDVRLGHIFSVLEKLRSLPLAAGDRLESEKYADLLNVYRTKGNLCAEEARSLNDILASLLKMMAKYDA